MRQPHETAEDVDGAESPSSPDIFETLKASIEEWARPILAENFSDELVLHVLRHLKENNHMLRADCGAERIKIYTLDFCKIASSLGTGIESDFRRIARCIKFVADHKLCNLANDAEIQGLATTLYKLAPEDYSWLVTAEPPPLTGDALQCLITIAMDGNWNKLKRIAHCIQFIADHNLVDDIKVHSTVISLAIRLSALSDANYAWLISSRGCPLGTDQIQRLLDTTSRDGLWQFANERGLEELHRRIAKRELFCEVKRLYDDVVRLTTEWGVGFLGFCAPTGAKEMVTKITQRKLILPTTYPISTTSTKEIDNTMDDIASILYKVAKASLEKPDVYARAEGTAAVYRSIVTTLKPCDEEEPSQALRASGGARAATGTH